MNYNHLEKKHFIVATIILFFLTNLPFLLFAQSRADLSSNPNPPNSTNIVDTVMVFDPENGTETMTIIVNNEVVEEKTTKLQSKPTSRDTVILIDPETGKQRTEIIINEKKK